MAINDTAVELLNTTIRSKKPVYFSASGVDITFETRIKKIDQTKVYLENTVRPEFITKVAKSEKFTIQVQMLRFQAENIDTDGQHIVFPLKDMTMIEETRQSERFPFTAEERVVCEILNPFDNETRILKSVMDMSATGLSIRTRFDSSLFAPGVELSDVRVLIDNKLYTAASGAVVYKRKLMTIKGKLRLQIGIKFADKQ